MTKIGDNVTYKKDKQLKYLPMIQDLVQQMTKTLHEAIEDFVAETA
ncbi:hypothetical protein [Coleofasciculus chthonoplastes]